MSGGDVVGEYGTLERAGGRVDLGYERRLSHPRQKVWRAITEDADLAACFPTTMEGVRRAGAPLRFSFREGEAAPFDGEMLAFVPPSLMELRWADDVLRFELEPGPDPDPDAVSPACILRLTVTFPEHGKAARDAAGWHVCLEQLAAACEGTVLPWQPPERWRVVHRVYVGRFGAEASAIGPPQE